LAFSFFRHFESRYGTIGSAPEDEAVEDDEDDHGDEDERERVGDQDVVAGVRLVLPVVQQS
jgi:hypothetical protein